MTSTNNNNNSKAWMESLLARQMQLAQQSKQIHDNWKSGRCTSQVAAVLGDWVRRVDVDYPYMACGSASETIYLTHLETGAVLAQAHVVETSSAAAATTTAAELPNQDHVYRILFGDHDGGGTLAIAFYDNLIATAGRQGSVDLWRVHTTVNSSSSSSSGNSGGNTGAAAAASTTTLIYQGRMIACQGVLVTSLQFLPTTDDDDGVFLWIGTADGRVLAFDIDDAEAVLPLAARRKPHWQYQFPNAPVILSMSFTTELHLEEDEEEDSSSAGVGVITTSAGNVHIISLSSNPSDETSPPPPQPSAWSFRLPMEATSARAIKALPTCACFVQHDVTHPNGASTTTAGTFHNVQQQQQQPSYWSIACGGSNGSLYLQSLHVLPRRRLDPVRPFDATQPPSPLLPRHWGPTHCVATPMPGLLLSSGQDGSIRVWDVSSTTTTTTTTTATWSSTSSSATSSPRRPLFRRRFLYQFHGYKVWLRSLWCGSTSTGSKSHNDGDGSASPILLSDGSDNTILMHNFHPKPTKSASSSNNNSNNNNDTKE
jgi:hypothetical protein